MPPASKTPPPSWTRSILRRLIHTAPARWTLGAIVSLTQYRVFAPRTVQAMRFDLLRLSARMRQPRTLESPSSPKLHLGCGKRSVPGWLNVDVASGDRVVDLASGSLPWPDASFQAIVSQHVIEHLVLEDELLPLLRELNRVSKPGAEIWLSCPDLEAICRHYCQDRGEGLIEDRLRRPHGDLGLDGLPKQHIVNAIFYQDGEHKNLLDFEMLEWLLRTTGFESCVRVREADLLARFPEFPRRNDDYHTVYAKARKPETPGEKLIGLPA
jgi:predicted SAM-dependent methyltransferase